MAAPVVRCKIYHRPRRPGDPARERGREFAKSKCPGWAMNADIQMRLLREALEDPTGGADAHGRPRRIYNAVGDVCFVGLSTNEPEPAYNCYPEQPLTTELRHELLMRARRSIDDLMQVPIE